ncbi:putative sugar-phosphate nucleotidyltransferase [Thermococcus cleftensis]|uniref:Sugar-phosphate nucleotidyltransferase n=1 Tax=Thermococcus cleftensis (strain DSM 27260 / KACC 17922 / CL1) TaxID=163003 RepID=I3ZRJ0_THECF|nr:NDP-sugar synthase [Thermococcus cleftensis]AFL94324.1 putative sugar-phosphate nucleotidyltransferase [Thermococcus cleftensis]
MKAVILAGGFGTRLRPISSTRPKPMVPVLGKPNLQYILESLEKVQEIDEVILSVHYMRGEIREFIEEKMVDYPKDIRFVNDPMPLETGGALKNVEEYVSEDFLVIYGDVFTNFDFRELIEAHRNNDGLITVAVTKVYDPEKYGVVELDDGNRVTHFEEKPHRPRTNLVDAGIYVVNRKVLEEIPKGKEVYFEREVLPKYVARGEVYAHKIPRGNYWIDLGTPEDLFYAHQVAMDEITRENGYFVVREGTEVPEDVEIQGPVYIDEGVKIGHGVKIKAYTYIGPNTVVEDRAYLKRSILIGHDVVRERAEIKDSILGEGVVVGKNVILKENAVVGDYARIYDNLVIYGAKILPWKKVEEYEAYIRIKLDPTKVRPGATPERCPLGLPECIYTKFKAIAGEKPPCDECIENQWLF